MALKLNGKNERLRRADFFTVATLAGLRAGNAHDAIDAVLEELRGTLDRLVVPAQCVHGPNAQAAVAKVIELCRGRMDSFA
ncbi:MAG: hypothetical protein K0B16_19295 [Burkholderiaceae bacterium]|nr:hypothetical protein [Burkholderiaceae bacterium]